MNRLISHIQQGLWKLVAFVLPHGTLIRRLVITRCAAFKSYRLPPLFRDKLLQAMIEKFAPGCETSECWFLGSSHVWSAIEPQVMKTRAWNFGITSGDLYTAYQILLKLLDRPTQKCKTVILGYDIWSHCLQQEFTSLVGVSVICHKLLGIPYRSTFGIRKWEALLDKALSQLPPDAPAVSQHGQSFFSQATNLSIPARLQSIVRATKHPPTELVWLRAMHELCIQRKIQFRILILPLHPQMVAQIPESQYFAPIRTGEFSGIPCYNFYQDPDFVEEDFESDGDHLSTTGAQKLSRKLDILLCNEKDLL